MAQAVEERTSLVFIANPNNPTGSYVTQGELHAFLEQLPPDVVAVVDEAYFEYANASDYPDALSLRHLHERLVVLRTFSKAYGLAGLRLGYAVAPAELCDYINRVRAPFNANSLAQVAALAALRDEAHLEHCIQLNTEQRERTAAALTDRGLKVVPSQANFVLVELGRPAAPVFEALLDEGVITRLVPPLPQALRISVGTPSETDRLLRAMEKVLL
jgi:histidinol-phosphate aminotransferase